MLQTDGRTEGRLTIAIPRFALRASRGNNDMQSFVGFPLIPKYVTLNSLKWYFTPNSLFAPVGLEHFCVALENDRVKTKCR